MRTVFTNEVMDELKKNPCVFSCTNNSVNYTYEFKKHTLELHKEGVTAREIWRGSGFNVEIWGGEYFGETLRDWRKIVRKYGVEGFLK